MVDPKFVFFTHFLHRANIPITTFPYTKIKLFMQDKMLS
jgi:hypothetical protein